MNVIFSGILIVSVGMLIYFNPDAILVGMLNGVEKGLTLSLTLLGIYAVWLTVLQIYTKADVTKHLNKIMRPITKRLFPKESDKAYEFLSLNLSANVMGMGGVATPMGISAMEQLTQKKNKIMLIIANSTSLQLIPTTVIAMRAGFNASADIILSSLIVSTVTTSVGILLVKVFVK